MKIKKSIALILTIGLLFTATACGDPEESISPDTGEITLDVFAPDASFEVMISIAHQYSEFYPGVKIRITSDTGAMLAAKIEAGYQCDVYLADEAMYMDWLDGTVDGDGNPNKNDCLISESRVELMTGPENSEDAATDPNILTYSLAVIKNSEHPSEAAHLLEYMKNGECDEIYETYGFSPAIAE